MDKSNVGDLNRPEDSKSDPLSELVREGAKRIIQEAVEIEIECFIEEYRNRTLEDGKQRVIRNGYLPVRNITTGVGGRLCKGPKGKGQIENGRQ